MQDGSLTNGLPDTNYETCRTTNFIDIKPSTNYAFSINGTLNRVVVSMYDKDKNFIATDGAGGYVSSNGLFTTYANAYYIKYRAYNADKQLFLNGNIQIEQGSTATPYVPHEEQDYSIYTQQPMRSIGDVRDKFVKKDGNWFERHYIGEVVLDGNSTINNFYPNSGRCDISISNALLRGLCLCNYYQYKFAEENNKCFISGATSAFCFINTDIKSIEEVRAWLNEKQPEVIYQLATPLDLPCTEEQIQQLENKPSTYKEMTIINSEDETKAYLEVAGIYDLNKLINN